MIAHEIARIERAFSKLPVNVQFVDHDPYRSYEQMRDSVLSSNQMLVWKGASETPLWSPLVNWKARAVHDWDHIVHGVDFSMEGEAAAFRHSAQRTPALAKLYLSEIMLQAAVQNYTGQFSPQKLVLVEPEVLEKATHMRGLRGAERDGRTGAYTADVVWHAREMLRAMSMAELMIHLRAMGYDLPDALAIADAAQMLARQAA